MSQANAERRRVGKVACLVSEDKLRGTGVRCVRSSHSVSYETLAVDACDVYVSPRWV